MGWMERIVIVTDDSPSARAAVETGLELARLLGASVTFVAVRGAVPIFGYAHAPRRLSDELRETRAALAGPMDEALSLGVEADFEIAEGPVAQEIVRTARYREADLIVAGAQRDAFGELVEISPLPVLVVKERPPSDVARRSVVPTEQGSVSASDARRLVAP